MWHTLSMVHEGTCRTVSLYKQPRLEEPTRGALEEGHEVDAHILEL